VYGGGKNSHALIAVEVDAAYGGGSLRPGGKMVSRFDIWQ
jgi:hypothetical protein